MSSSIPHILLPPRTLSSFIAFYQTNTQTPSSTTASSSSTPLHSTNSNNPPTKTLNMHTRRNNGLVETRTTKPTLMTRLRGRNAKTRTVEPASEEIRHGHTTAGTRNTRSSRGGRNTRRNEPVEHHRRHASMGDKISGAMMKLKGSLTRRPGVKVCCLS